MRNFYLDIARRMGVAMKKATYIVEAAIGVAVFMLARFNQDLATRFTNWDGINPAWAWVPVVLVFGHLFLNAVYDKYTERENQLSGELTLAKFLRYRDSNRFSLAAATWSKSSRYCRPTFGQNIGRA